MERSCTNCNQIVNLETGFYKDKALVLGYKSICKSCQQKKDQLKHQKTYIATPKSLNCKVKDCSSNKSKGRFCLQHFKEYKAVIAKTHRSCYPRSLREIQICSYSNCSNTIGHSSVYKYCRPCYDKVFAKIIKERRRKYLSQKRELISQKVKNRYHTDLLFRLKTILRSRLLTAFKKQTKIGSAISDLGCSIEELKKHLESKFQEGMSWDNYGKGEDKWNIDHIRPLSSFAVEEIKFGCHYSNLQPLWEVENLKKGSIWR